MGRCAQCMTKKEWVAKKVSEENETIPTISVSTREEISCGRHAWAAFLAPSPPFPQYHHTHTTITGLDGNPPQHFYRLPMQRWTTGVLQASHQGTDHDKATGPTPRYHMPKKKARLEDADHLVCCPELKSQNISCYTTFKWNRDKEARAWTQ